MGKIKTLVIVSGYFNPIHEGHIEYLNRSKALGDFLFVKAVDDVIVSIDENKFVDRTIELIVREMGDKFDRILFTNGGDQTAETIGEKDICEKLGIEMVFGLGDKIQSSSWLLNKI